MTTGIIYTASLDTFAKIVTIGVIIFFAALIFYIVRILKKIKSSDHRVLKIIYSVVIAILIGALGFSYLYSPRKYLLGNFDIAISRPIGDITIHVKDILEIRPVKESEMEGTIRTFGVGGLFGYYGNYHNEHIGDFKMYATRQHDLVLIHTKQGEAIVISPDDKGFVDRIKAKMEDL